MSITKLFLEGIEVREFIDLHGTISNMITVCSYCTKVRNNQGKWIDFEFMGLLSTGKIVSSHSICYTCYNNLSEFIL